MATLPISVQLYTVRDLLAKDFADTVKKVAQIGYRYVEMAGYGSLKSAGEAKKALDDAGLKISAAHASMEALETDLNKVLDDNAQLSNTHIICPFMPEPRRKDASGWKATGAALNKIGQACQARGFDFSYHHHSFEFQKFDGKSGFDILWENSDPKLVQAELDVYWLKHGGEDPVASINKLGKRTLFLHLKDMAPGEERRFAPVGTGILDFKAILDVAAKTGVKYGAVEQDNCYETPPLEALKISYENLRKLGAA